MGTSSFRMTGRGRADVAGGRRVGWLVALLLLAPSGAWAHPPDLLVLRVDAQDGRLYERLTLSPRALTELVPGLERSPDGLLTDAALQRGRAALERGVWEGLPLEVSGARCVLEDSGAELGRAFVALRAQFRCPDGAVNQWIRLLSVLPVGHHLQVVRPDGGEWHFAGGPQARPERVPLGGVGTGGPEKPEPGSFFQWVKLGVIHILGGWDHLLFLLALLLTGGSAGRLLGVLTAFTAAHALTLGLAVWDAVRLTPERSAWVEVAIAGTLIYVAVENLFRTTTPGHRWEVMFALGLVHGLGLAQALLSSLEGQQETGRVLTGLLGFNVGVELGQVMIVLGVLPLLAWLRRRPRAWAWTVRGFSLGLVGVGTFWLVARVSG